MLVQLPQGMVLTSWIKMADSAGYRKKEKNESGWSCKDRRWRQSEERERLGRRRTSWLEQRKLSEGRNYRRVLQEPRFWGGVAFEWNEYRRTVVRRTFRAGLRNVVHSPSPSLERRSFRGIDYPLVSHKETWRRQRQKRKKRSNIVVCSKWIPSRKRRTSNDVEILCEESPVDLLSDRKKLWFRNNTVHYISISPKTWGNFEQISTH